MYLWLMYYLCIAVVISFLFYFLINILKILRMKTQSYQELINISKDISRKMDLLIQKIQD